MVCADDACYENNDSANFNENFAAVEPVDGMMLEVGVGEEGVPEEGDGPEIDGEVERFPEAAAELNAEIGCEDHEGEDVEGDGADGVFERLLRRMDGIDDIEDAKFWRLVDEQNYGVENRENQGEIAGPVVQLEIIETAMRPVAHRAVTKDHQNAEEHVDGDGANCDETEIGGEVEDGDFHWFGGRAVGILPALQPRSFHIGQLVFRVVQ